MEWDPLADVGAEGPVFLETVDMAGAQAPIVKDDFERARMIIYKKVVMEEPWQRPPESQPDLSWHVPTCSLDKWTHKDVKCNLSEGVTYITLNRPNENNVLNETIIAGLCDAIFLLHGQKESIRAVVFTAEGKMFCGGGDTSDTGFKASQSQPQVKSALEEMTQRAVQGGAFTNGNVNLGRLLQAKLWHTWITLPQFTICLCNGSAMGVGLGCVCVCDMAIAVKSAFFVVSEVKLGLVPANLAPYVTAKVGSSNAKRMFCMSENMSAENAKSNHLINEVVDSVDAGHKMIHDICARITQCGPKTVDFAKQVIHAVSGQALSEPLMFYTSAQLSLANISEEAKVAAKLGVEAKKPWEEKPIKPLF